MKKTFILIVVLLCSTISRAIPIIPSWEYNGIYYEDVETIIVSGIPEKIVKVSTRYENDSPNGTMGSARMVFGVYSGDIVIPSEFISNGGYRCHVQGIGSCAFKNCDITSVTIPNSVKFIEQNAFECCYGLHSIDIPDSVDSIGETAFNRCNRIEYVRIGKNLKSIADNAFYNCSRIKRVDWNAFWIWETSAFLFPSTLESITFGDDVAVVPARICSGKTNLTEVVMSDNVTVIGESAFFGCSNLMEVHFPNALNQIGSKAFSNTGLWSATIPEGVYDVSHDAFSGCHITTINWNVDNTVLEYRVIDFGPSVKHINFGNKVKVIPASICKNKTFIEEVYIPASVIRIATSAFEGCSGLRSLSLGAGLKRIGTNAFSGCSNLSSALSLPNNVDTILTGAFANCNKIPSITINQNMKSIEGSAFYGCISLKKVYNFSSLSLVPTAPSNGYVAYYADRVYNNMDVQGEFIFSGNSLLGYTGNATNITLPATYKGSTYSIGTQAFADASQITTITIPEAVSTIGSSAFAGCTGLTSLSLPNSVTQVGDNAFDGCSNVTSVSIGANTQRVGENAFVNCRNIQDITCSAQTPPTAYANTFSNVPTSATLYVPAGSRSAYQNAQGWSRFNNIVENNLVNVTGVSLNASTLTLAKKGEAVLYATITPSNATYKTVTWSSSNTNIVEVTNGVVYGKNAGTATVTCTTTNGGKSATCEVTVMASEVLATGFQFYKSAYEGAQSVVPHSLLNAEDTLTFMELATGFITANVMPYSVTNGAVNFIVEDPSVLSASLTSHINFQNSIRLDPLRPGTTKITFSTTDGTNISSSVYVTITPDPTIKVTGIRILKKEITLAAKEKDTLSVQIFPADATNTEVNWTSEDGTIASVLHESIYSNRGVVTAKNLGKTGPVKIICTTKDGGYSDTCVVTVIKNRVYATGLTLNHSSKTLNIGETLQLSPVFTPSNATNQNVYWYTDNDTIISLHDGLVQALHEGVDTVRCFSEDGNFEAKCVITVQGIPTSISVTSISLDKTTLTLNVGDSETLTAIITPSNATNKNVTWTSSKSSIATVSSDGIVKGIAEGNAIITCTTEDGGFTATCQVSVSALSGEEYETMYLLGNIASGDWSTALEMEKVSKNKFQVVETLTQPTSYFCFVYDLGDGTSWEYINAHRFGGNNNNLLAPGVVGSLIAGEKCFTAAAGTYTFTIDMNTMKAWIEYFTEGIDDITVDSKSATKILYNGQVFILRGDKTYTITGQEVK